MVVTKVSTWPLPCLQGSHGRNQLRFEDLFETPQSTIGRQKTSTQEQMYLSTQSAFGRGAGRTIQHTALHREDATRHYEAWLASKGATFLRQGAHVDDDSNDEILGACEPG